MFSDGSGVAPCVVCSKSGAGKTSAVRQARNLWRDRLFAERAAVQGVRRHARQAPAQSPLGHYLKAVHSAA